MTTTRPLLTLILTLFALALSLPQSYSNELLIPRKFIHPSVKPDRQYPGEKLGFRSGVCRRNLLGLERPYPGALPTLKRGLPIDQFQVDTLRICALRIDFQYEDPDDPRTTGRGQFDLRTYEQFQEEEEHYIDPAPHNREYFKAHLQALHNYWYSVSNHKLVLTYDVWPPASESSYRLPVAMGHYGENGPWGDNLLDRLGHFFIDAVTFADSVSPEIDFSGYQSVIIFHAGADQQNNLPFVEDTPDDLFSGFIIMTQPVMVDSGGVGIEDGLIIPETVSQDNRIGALNASLAHEFGHQLGLVDLYRTYDFFTQIGDFSLMDNNGLSVGADFPDIGPAVFGTLPVYPEAWSRAYLGFSLPEEISNEEGIELIAAEMVRSGIEVVKLPVDANEYFLLENRRTEVDFKSEVPYPNVLIGDPESGVILGPGYAFTIGDSLVKVLNDEYDRLLPGNGILIWRVDEVVCYLDYLGNGVNNFLNNTLQWDIERRFVTLMEADGIIDFGGNYHAGYGSAADMWRQGNNSNFTPYTKPSTESHLGAYSGIYVTDISLADTTMTFDGSREISQQGWPQTSVPGLTDCQPTVVDVDGDSLMEVFQVWDNVLLAWRYDGSKLIDNADSIGIVQFDGSVRTYPLASFSLADSNFVGTPAFGDIDGDDTLEVILGSRDGKLYAWKPRDSQPDGGADLVAGFPVDLGAPVSTSPMVFVYGIGLDDDQLTIAIAAGTTVFLVYEGNIIDSFSSRHPITGMALSIRDEIVFTSCGDDSSFIHHYLGQEYAAVVADSFFNPVTGDIDHDDSLEIVAATAGGHLYVFNVEGELESGWPRQVADTLSGPPILGDIDGDGFLEIILTGENEIYAYNYTGSLLSNFPVELSRSANMGLIKSTPVLGDLDGDGLVDITFGGPQGNLYAYRYDASPVSGFPLPSGFPIYDSPAVADLDNDGDLEVMSRSYADGFISFWDLAPPFSEVNLSWPTFGQNPGNTFRFPSSLLSPIVVGEFLPPGSVYNYPNPAGEETYIRYYLNQPAEVNIKLFDLAGELVFEHTEQGQPTDNDYLLDCMRFAPGVYLCRVGAEAGSTKEHALFKIAILR
jgi:M6 family metalloprotease-like protein